MITYIKGELTEIFDSCIVVENESGIGFSINVPASVFNQLPSVGTAVRIYTYMNVKEDDISLYGFMNRDDLDIFRMLLTVNGIGPKGALGILSTISPDDLRFAVLSDDVKVISSAPGIGAKTAQKLIIELKDKIKLQDAFEMKLANNADMSAAQSGAREDTILALTALGYSRSEAVHAVGLVDNIEEKDSELVLKEALKKLAIL